MNYNYHTHTFRFRHASGTEEEYIQTAIAGGIRKMGFSDHAPFAFPDGHQSGFRIPLEQAEEYVRTVSALREKYADQLQIYIGFEMEYYPTHFSKMLETVKNLGAEYLILGQHFIFDEYPNGVACGNATEDVERLAEYANCVIAAIKSGVFTYVAHPDACHFVGDPAAYDREMRRICVASREANIPLEINFLGLRTNRYYPNETFWKIVGEEGCPVTFGCDAHDPQSAFDADSLCKARRLVSEYNLRYIDEPTLQPLK